MSKWPIEYDASFSDLLTNGEVYGPAMEITDPEEAKFYFEKLVVRTMRVSGCTREEAIVTEKTNLGYYSGYYDQETIRRVQNLFDCKHPILGSADDIAELDARTVFALGVMQGKQMRDELDGRSS